MHEDALCAHADLAGVEEGANDALARSGVEVCVVADDGGRFAAEFEEDGFELLASEFGDDAAHGCAAGEVDLFDLGVFNDCLGDGGAIGWAGGDEVEDAGGQAGFVEDGSDCPEAAGGEFASFEDDGVAGCNGPCYGAETESIRSVPNGVSMSFEQH